MLSSIESRRTKFNPSARGYHAVYHDGEINHCPGCGRTHWLIGRVSAECAFCSTALPLRREVFDGAGRIQQASTFTSISYRPPPRIPETGDGHGVGRHGRRVRHSRTDARGRRSQLPWRLGMRNRGRNEQHNDRI